MDYESFLDELCEECGELNSDCTCEVKEGADFLNYDEFFTDDGLTEDEVGVMLGIVDKNGKFL